MIGQLVQILTGHTHLKRHQAVIDEAERQRHLEALNWDNADDNGNAIIDAPDPPGDRCKVGEEPPLHRVAECKRLATLRLQIFGREDLVAPGAVPDFSDLPVYKLVSFFKEAKFETLSMLPFRAQYLPTNTSNEDSNRSLRDRKSDGDKKGKAWISRYLFHIPLKQVNRLNRLNANSDNDETLPEASASGGNFTPIP